MDSLPREGFGFVHHTAHHYSPPPPTQLPHTNSPQVRNFAVDFVLKTDDDAFVNVPSMVLALRALCESAGCTHERLYIGRMAKSSEVGGLGWGGVEAARGGEPVDFRGARGAHARAPAHRAHRKEQRGALDPP